MQSLIVLTFLCTIVSRRIFAWIPQSPSPVSVIRTTCYTSQYSVVLAAKKKPRKVRSVGTTSGFGGSATQPCACGSGIGYNKCCGRLHKDAAAYAAASAEQVVRGRYTAYANRVIDFIIDSTHPENHNFMSDIDHWRQQIDMNCYDKFILKRCEILDEKYAGSGKKEVAVVQFHAFMTQRDLKESTSFIETSTFLRHPETGAWLYRDGVIEPPEEQDVENEEEAGEE